eukprot:TRINITY_DN4902_c0_g2_i2.p1 TRINITY_DN4902_c0_g2~~TRINITY_DN4902_c0_g2_i2.p1  ORF type:complete len:516 (+),score=80.81 TRINITY_DN4902_c0_g2_i2:298-1845(+)
MGDHGSKQWMRKCRKFLKKIEAAVPVETQIGIEQPLTSASDSVPASPQVAVRKTSLSTTPTQQVQQSQIQRMIIREDKEEQVTHGEQKSLRRLGKEYFFEQVSFMNELVQISHRLALKFNEPENFKSELARELQEIQSFVQLGNAVLPHRGNECYRVVRILFDECYPIPTYGRVLYLFMAEVWPVGQHYTRDLANEYLKIKIEGDVACSESQAESENEELLVPPSRTGAFGEIWPNKVHRIKNHSPFGSLPGWNCSAFIVKHGDFVLQEQFVMQLVRQFQQIFKQEGLSLRLTTYNIMALTNDSGLIQVIHNAKSIDKLKQLTPDCPSLKAFFKAEWPDKEEYEKARTNFVNSLAAYCVLCYFLQIKDRHNGNIMLDANGYLMHIDFGFLLGRTVKFEKAPFKLTEEMIDLLDGDKSKHFNQFLDLLVEGFLAVRRNYEKVMLLIEMTLTRPSMECQFIPCLEKDTVLKNLRKRFKLEFNDAQIREFVTNLVSESRDNWRTTIYDTYQRILNDIH